MSSISIIGTGNMASALAGRALAGGNAVEIVGRDPVKAKELATALGGATVGTAGTAPAGDIVILAVPYASAAAAIGQYGDALTARSSSTSPTPSPPISRALSPRRAVPARRRSPRPPPPARMSSRRSTPCPPTFWRPVRRGRPLDVFIAGDDAQAKARVGVHREPRTAPDGHRAAAHGAGTGERRPAAAGPRRPLRQAHQLLLGVSILS